MKIEELVGLMENRNVVITSTMVSKLQHYLQLLQEWNKKIDLTAIKEDQEIIEKHFYDSMLIFDKIPSVVKSVLDLGSGAGFPGIPLKIICPHLKVTLLEPTTKRADFLNLVIQELQLTNITVINKRAEELVITDREVFDLVTARAVARLNILLELAIPLLRVDGYLLAMKGQKIHEEIKEAEKALLTLHSQVCEIYKEELPSNGEHRFNVLIHKKATTNQKYPRHYGVIKNRPL